MNHLVFKFLLFGGSLALVEECLETYKPQDKGILRHGALFILGRIGLLKRLKLHLQIWLRVWMGIHDGPCAIKVVDNIEVICLVQADNSHLVKGKSGLWDELLS